MVIDEEPRTINAVATVCDGVSMYDSMSVWGMMVGDDYSGGGGGDRT